MNITRRSLIAGLTLMLAACGLSACGQSDADQIRATVSDFSRSLDKRRTEHACVLLTTRAEAQMTSFLRIFGGTGDCAHILKRLDEDGEGRLSQRAIASADVAIRDELATLTARRGEGEIGLRHVQGRWRIDNIFDPSLEQRPRRGDPRLAHGSDERQIRATLTAVDTAIGRKDYERVCAFVSDAAEAQLFMVSAFASLLDEPSGDVRRRKDVDFSCATALRRLGSSSTTTTRSWASLPSRAQLRAARVSVRGSHATVKIPADASTAMIRVDGRWLLDADYGVAATPAS